MTEQWKPEYNGNTLMNVITPDGSRPCIEVHGGKFTFTGDDTRTQFDSCEAAVKACYVAYEMARKVVQHLNAGGMLLNTTFYGLTYSYSHKISGRWVKQRITEQSARKYLMGSDEAIVMDSLNRRLKFETDFDSPLVVSNEPLPDDYPKTFLIVSCG